MPYQSVEPEDLDALLQRPGLTIIDQRDPQTRLGGELPGAIAPDEAVIQQLLRKRREDPLVLVYCYHGNMSRELCSFLAGMGLSQVYNLAGGWAALEAWRQAD